MVFFTHENQLKHHEDCHNGAESEDEDGCDCELYHEDDCENYTNCDCKVDPEERKKEKSAQVEAFLKRYETEIWYKFTILAAKREARKKLVKL